MRLRTQDWVKPSERGNAYGGVCKRKILVPCASSDPDACHRGDISTVGYVLAFLAVLLARGAFSVRSAMLFWEASPHGLSVPWVRNALSPGAYLQMLHFVDNMKLW